MALPPNQRNLEILKALGGDSLVFVGMMGCGKSAIGRMVADALDLDFVDSDTEIEKSANGMKVAEIFDLYGEQEFRRVEERVISRLVEEQGPIVISLGGGAYMNPTTREAIRSSSTAIWLQAELDVLVARVSRKPEKRPLLANGDPAEILSELLDKRERLYAEADIQVQTAAGSKAQTREAVLNALHAYYCPTFAA